MPIYAFAIVKIIDLWLFILFVSVILSWFPSEPTVNKVRRFLDSITDPVMGKVYDITNGRFTMNGIDFTPMLVFVVGNFIRNAIIRLF